MNSFRFIERGIRAEIARQEKILRAGERVTQETLHFDPISGAITSLRSKEEAHDYRYFPEPDLVPVAIEQTMLDAAAGAMGELPAARAERLEKTLGLSSRERPAAGLPRRARRLFRGLRLQRPGAEPAPPAQALANWISSDLLGRLEDGAGAGGGAGGIRFHRVWSPRRWPRSWA